MPPQESPTPAPQASHTLQSLATPIAIVIAGAFIAVGIYFSGHTTGATQEPQGQGQGVTTAAQMKSLIQTNRTEALFDASAKGAPSPFIGKSDAPLTMTYWFDYQCPFCKQFEETVMPTLVSKYVNTGKLKIVFKDFPFLGNDSVTAAEYAQAVWELYPEKFYDWTSAMFDVQDSEGDQGFGDAKSIETLTSLIPGIDVGKIRAAVTAHKDAYDQSAARERQEGATAGVNGTPGFLIGKTLVSGAQPLATFTQEIDKQLAGK